MYITYFYTYAYVFTYLELATWKICFPPPPPWFFLCLLGWRASLQQAGFGELLRLGVALLGLCCSLAGVLLAELPAQDRSRKRRSFQRNGIPSHPPCRLPFLVVLKGHQKENHLFVWGVFSHQAGKCVKRPLSKRKVESFCRGLCTSMLVGGRLCFFVFLFFPPLDFKGKLTAGHISIFSGT